MFVELLSYLMVVLALGLPVVCNVAMTMNGERAFTAWHHFNHVKESAVGATPGIFPFTYASQAVNSLQQEQQQGLHDQAPNLPPEDYEDCYRQALWERDPGLADDVFRYLDIMEELVGRVCSINFLNSTQNSWRGLTGQRTLRRFEPVRVLASGLKPVFDHTPFPLFFSPAIEIESALDETPGELPGNPSWQGRQGLVYPWSRVRSVTIIG